MPQHINRSRRSVKRKQGTRKRRVKRGGKLKPSEILGAISGTAAGASALGVVAPFTLPLAGITGLASGILRLFGKGGVTPQQAAALRRAEKRGIVLAKAPLSIRKRRR